MARKSLNDPSHREIERRYLIEQIPNLSDYPSAEVLQGYLTGPPTIVRLRSHSNTGYFMTVKRGAQADHEEREITITQEQFCELWPLTEGRRIQKTRYRIPYGDLVIELDFFHGRHEGLKIAEVEFPNHEASLTFSPLAWFGREITEEICYANVTLAME